tara:strand:- start:204 stop:1001 length:798 start_codon:yes stop_codon:yes gene_type:complete
MIKLTTLSIMLMLSFSQAQSQTQSKVLELLVAGITKIPVGPYPELRDDMCKWFRLEPKTIAGIELQRSGWGVMSEISLGPYQFVSFAGEFNSGTSGMCQRKQGNIGVFQNQKITSIIYTKPEDNYLIGNLEVIEGGAIRVLSGGFVEWPVADIKLTSESYEVEEISKLQSFCAGKSIVPNIYGNTIPEARTKLLQYGWKPSKSGDGLWTRAQKMKDSGITEVQSCSGFGFARCFFNYDGVSASLEVVTLGEVSEVVNSYSVQCIK